MNFMKILYSKSLRISTLISIFTLLITGAMTLLPGDTEASTLQGKAVALVWTNGQLYTKANANDEWQKSADRQFPEKNYFLIKPPELESGQKANTGNATTNYFAVLRYADNEVVILSKRGEFHRDAHKYQIKGAAHIIRKAKNLWRQELQTINNFNMFVGKAHLFFQDIKGPAKLMVINGDVGVYPQQNIFLSLEDGIKPESGKIKLSVEHLVELESSYGKLKLRPTKGVPYFSSTYLPGFENKGEYIQVGYLVREEGNVTLKRNDSKTRVTVPMIPVMLHDELKTGRLDKIRLALHTGDVIRLYPGSDFVLNEFPTPGKFAMLTEKKTSGKPTLLRFEGKIRVTAKSGIHNKRYFRLKSATAVIGVRGTEFETTASESVAEVLTLSGLVRLSDNDEQHSVDIKPGKMSSVEKNQPPKSPVDIPKDKLMELITDSLEPGSTLAMSTYNPVDINNIPLYTDSSASLFWNSPLAKGEVFIENQVVLLENAKATPELIIPYQPFSKFKPGIHDIKIKVTDKKGRVNEISAMLNIDPKVLIIKNKIQFETGKPDLRPESFSTLDQLIDTIKSNPQFKVIAIEGHTDNVGSEQYNQRLSQKRADTVMRYLIKQGVDSKKLRAIGYGETKPVADNSTDEGKEQNRRVVFSVK